LGVLDGFLSTWTRARTTFGEGVPQTGERFDQGGPLRQLQTAVASAAPGSRWTGDAASSYETANAKHGKVFGDLAVLDRQLSSRVTEASQIVAKGRRSLDAVRRWVLDAAATVPEGKNRDQQLMKIVNSGLGQLREIVNGANAELNRVGGEIRAVGSGYQTLKDGMQFGVPEGPELDGAAGEETGERKPEDMEELVRKALAGDQQAAAEVDGLLNNVSDEQLGPNAVAHPLNPLHAELVGQLQAQMKPMSLDDVNAARERLGDNKSVLSNALQVMSNPNITYPRHDGEGLEVVPSNPQAGLPSRSVEPGNSGALPDSVQRTLNLGGDFDGPPGPQAGYPGSAPVDHDGGPRREATDGLATLATIVGDGDTRFQQGTELDRGMMNSAKEFLNAQASPDGQQHWGDDVVQRVFETAGRDTVVSHDMFTADRDFTHNVLTHEWSDDGRSASTLTNWIGDAANSPDPAVSARAGETASALAEYMGDPGNKDALMNIGGASQQNVSMGQLNPHLAQSLAHAMVPYVDDMAGRDLDGTTGWQPIDGQSDMSYPHAANVFATLGTDDGAAQILDGRSTLVQAGFINEYAQSVIDHTGPVDNSAMEAAGRLRGITEQGAFLSELDQHSDIEQARKAAYERLSSNYDTVKDMAGVVPFVGPGLTLQADLMKDAIVGPAPGDGSTGHTAIASSEAMKSALASTFIAHGVGNSDTLAPFLDENGDQLLVPRDDVTSRQYFDFQNALNHFLDNVDGGAGPLASYDQAYRDVLR
jgi:hypothetical protein